ncbi:MAG: hypothetical protein BECKG1743D_GA0114223_101264 [Candidatus Kentron sp. G]|nr:MAG: hypothetical protein BECKG1743F_GA0114225_101043 [Candidatus Kentron sp. G]VFM96975.1 MAG: hypothetical protein BECKG1743E_GA0114224_101023 [Candidatus Kentron sp. G]VFM99484.1 MAG: hypothetical protein BECKG1743D_GA0114223_101264 [Candidatus Kentron sp. G]
MPLHIRIGRWIIAGLLGCLPCMAPAETAQVPEAAQPAPETAYVIDRVLLGVYKDKKLSGTALEILPTGASLMVLSRDKKLAKVRTMSEIIGWVDANYLMAEKPAQILLMELEAAHEQTRRRLREARLELQEPAAGSAATGTVKSRFGFLFPSLTYRQWILLTPLFLLVFFLGGYTTHLFIIRRYYLVKR